MVWEGVSGVKHDSRTIRESSCIPTHILALSYMNLVTHYDDMMNLVLLYDDMMNLEELDESYDDLVLLYDDARI